MRACLLKIVEMLLAPTVASSSSAGEEIPIQKASSASLLPQMNSKVSSSSIQLSPSSELLQACALLMEMSSELRQSDLAAFGSNKSFKISDPKVDPPQWILSEVRSYNPADNSESNKTTINSNDAQELLSQSQSILLCMYRKLELLLRQLNFSVYSTLEVNMMERARYIHNLLEKRY